MKHLKRFNESESESEGVYTEFSDKYAKMRASLNVALTELHDIFSIETEGDGVQEYPGGSLVYRIKLSDFTKIAGVFKKDELYKLKEDFEKMSQLVEACHRVLKKMVADGFIESDIYINSNEISFQIK